MGHKGTVRAEFGTVSTRCYDTFLLPAISRRLICLWLSTTPGIYSVADAFQRTLLDSHKLTLGAYKMGILSSHWAHRTARKQAVSRTFVNNEHA